MFKMMAAKKRSIQTDSGVYALHKEWDEALCPICMEHPHNAVLLVCSSHGKGCRTYICDTSYRHSNCLDRYKKVKIDCDASPPVNEQNPNNTPERSGELSEDDVVEVLQSQYPRGRSSMDPVQNENYGSQIEDLEVADFESSMARAEKMDLKCPLCRGDVQGWKIADEAREFLNMKSRSCSSDSCQFVGNYQELRRHARSVHPSDRPAEIDPSRQQAWRSFETQRHNDDVVSAIHSAMPGAIVLGDYVLETDNNDRNTTQSGSSSIWTSYFLSQMLAETRARSRHRRVSNASSYRERYLEMLGLGLPDESDDDNHSEVNATNVNNEEPSLRRRRRDEADVINVGDSEPAYRRMYLTLLGLGEENDNPSHSNDNNNDPSLRRRRDEVDVIDVDDDDDDVEELPVQRRRRLTQMAPNRNG